MTATAVDRDRRERMAEIVNAQPRKPRRRTDHVPCLVHRDRPAAGAVGAPLLRREDGAGGRRKPDRARTRLAVGQNRVVAVNVLPFEAQRLGLARAGVEQEAQRGDRDRMVRFRAVERTAERGELVVRQIVRLEARLAPPQSLARVGVLAPQSERLRVLHHRRHRRERPVRRAGARCRDIVVPVAHVLRADRIDRATAERRQYPALHGMRVRLSRRRLPPFGAVGEERRCTIHVLRPFAAAKARALAIVIFVLFAMLRSLPFVSVATGASRAPRWGTPRTRRVTAPGSKVGRVGSAALKRRAGCKPL